MKKKGFSYHLSLDDIRKYLALSTQDKLNWLEEANRLNSKALRGKTKRIWEMFRRGEI